MKIKRMPLIAELALIIADVFVFRSLWLQLDSLVVADRRERSYGLGVTLHLQIRRQVSQTLSLLPRFPGIVETH